jgi:hypothetical protein
VQLKLKQTINYFIYKSLAREFLFLRLKHITKTI